MFQSRNVAKAGKEALMNVENKQNKEPPRKEYLTNVEKNAAEEEKMRVNNNSSFIDI